MMALLNSRSIKKSTTKLLTPVCINRIFVKIIGDHCSRLPLHTHYAGWDLPIWLMKEFCIICLSWCLAKLCLLQKDALCEWRQKQVAKFFLVGTILTCFSCSFLLYTHHTRSCHLMPISFLMPALHL